MEVILVNSLKQEHAEFSFFFKQTKITAASISNNNNGIKVFLYLMCFSKRKQKQLKIFLKNEKIDMFKQSMYGYYCMLCGSEA